MKKLSLFALLIAACGPQTTTISQPVITNATGKAAEPKVEIVPASTTFDTAEATKTYSLTGADVTALWPLIVGVQAVPTGFGDSLIMSAVSTSSATSEIVFSAVGKADTGCKMTFAAPPYNSPSGCAKDMFAGIKLIPAPTKIDVTVTLSAGTTQTLSAQLLPPAGAARTLGFGHQGSIAKIALPEKQAVEKLAETAVTGVINVAEPSTGASDLSATVLFIVDYNGDGLITTDEVTQGTVVLAEDVQMSTIITTAIAEKLVNAAIVGPLNYTLVVLVRSKAGNISASAAKTGLDVKASLSLSTTATLKATK